MKSIGQLLAVMIVEAKPQHTFELLRNCFSLPSESKNGHARRKNGCPPRVHFQATNVNAISVPSGRIVRRPTRIDTSMQSVDASCAASNNSRKLPVTMEVTSSKPLLEWFFRSVFGNAESCNWYACASKPVFFWSAGARDVRDRSRRS